MRRRGKMMSAFAGVQMSLIVTPMLDMSFQILSFFVMNYHPSALEGHIDGNLLPPSLVAARGKTDKIEDFPAIDEQPPLEDVLLVIVKTIGKIPGERSDGEPRRILLKRPEAAAPVPLVEDDSLEDKSLKAVRDELTKVAREPGQSKANIKIEGDGDLKHQYLMRVYDACKHAGFQNISFVAPGRERPPGGK